MLEGTNVEANRALSTLVAGLAAAPAGGDARLNRGAQPAIATEYVHAGPVLDVVDALAPALIAFFAFFFVFLLTTVALIRERTSRTLDRLMASPLRQPELVVGYSLGLGVYALAQSLLVTGLSVAVLQLHVYGDLGAVFLVVALLTVGAGNLGILASSFARNEFQALQFIPIVIVPQTLLSVAFFPVEVLPGWAQGLGRAFPLTYAVEAMRKVMVAGASVGAFEVWWRLLVLAAFALGFVVLGAIGLRRQR